MSVSPEAVAEWRAHIGNTERQEQMLDIESLRRFAVASGLDADVERHVPALAHWAWFLPTVPDAQIGPDGHPRRGGFLPAITLPRRMFASAEIAFEAPPVLGAAGELATTVSDLTHKSGKSGDLVFLQVERVLSQQGSVRVRERQTLVYRPEGAAVPLPEDKGAGGDWNPASVNLFRFSAATFNSHRIHYDHGYATAEEGYPALVVHGPFTAVKLAALAEAAGGRGLATFGFRGVAPLFVDQPIRLTGDAAQGEFAAIRCDDVTAMTAKVSYR